MAVKRLAFKHQTFSSKELRDLHTGQWLPENTSTYRSVAAAMEEHKVRLKNSGDFIIDEQQCGLIITPTRVEYHIYGHQLKYISPAQLLLNALFNRPKRSMAFAHFM